MLVLQLELMIEEVGHVFVGSAAGFNDVKAGFDTSDFDLALVDIDLADGRTGGEVVEWLGTRGKPSLFITGQEQLAAAHEYNSFGTIIKPVSEETLRTRLEEICERLGKSE